MALVGPAHQAGYIVRVQAGDELEMSKQAIEAEPGSNPELRRGRSTDASDLSCSGVYVRFLLGGEVDLPALTSCD